MDRLLGTLGVLLAVVLVTAVPQGAVASPRASAADRDCSSFDNQRQAQSYFIDRGGPSSDPDRLDGEGDGVACQTLPCPCGGRGPARPRPNSAPPPHRRAQTIRARVTEVIDGDTVRVRPVERTGRRHYTVRLIGIDTPEVYGGVECGGPQASVSMKRLAPAGRRVLLRTDPTQDTFDRYDRLLAYVKLRGGPDAAMAQLRAGLARVYVYGGRPFRRVRAFRQAQRSARRARRGVWTLCGRVYAQARTAAAAARLRHCGDLNFNTGNIRARGIGCRVARRVARQWRGTTGFRSHGFGCRYRSIGYEAGKIGCARGDGARIVFFTGA